ncbi:hypothetical protein N7495_000305 [Penicillium taxi]|uniref:uncharacterized protein n=1 Tax=Penicillium taxi TaxID=168475 RepID=UPI002545BBE0|nr:uncharacterized protein N7495_000305 [Penicillium taxi]KAJ5907623.1 hypothetical protein N7495_000305 [Penicillium taxi]
MSANSATSLLFALLCLIALEIDEGLNKKNPDLKATLRLAVTFLGQDFIFSPPINHDSITVCLVLADYKPTALATTRAALHRAIKSELFVNLAYRMAEKLGEVSGKYAALAKELDIADNVQFDDRLCQTIRYLQIVYYDIFLDGYFAKSHQALRQVLAKTNPIVEAYQSISNRRRCSPRTIFHIFWATSTCILLKALADIKEYWVNPGSLFAFIEETEKKCLDEIKTSKTLLKAASGLFEAEEVVGVQCLLELRFNSIIVRVWGLGLLHAAVLRARSQEGIISRERDIGSHEAIHISAQVTHSKENVLADAAEPFAMVLRWLGAKYPEKLGSLLNLFIECTNLKMGGISFRPPFQHLAFEVLIHCKNLLENNIVQWRCFGRLNVEFEKQLELFTICAQRFDSMVSGAWTSTDTAFSHGCIFAANSKLITGFCVLMRELKEKSLEKKGEESEGTREGPVESEVFNTFTNLSDPYIGGSNTSTGASNLWPYIGEFDPLANPQELFGWIETMNTSTELGTEWCFPD